MGKLGLVIACALLGTGCLDSIIPGHGGSAAPTADLAQPTINGNAGGGGGGGGGGSMTSDGDGGTTGSAKQFGELCTTDGAAGDCASGMCKQFVGGTVMRCTASCTYVSQTAPAPECANPPSAGLCTTNSYCKFTQ